MNRHPSRLSAISASLAVAAVLTLSACGNDSEPGPATDPSSTPSPSITETATATPSDTAVPSPTETAASHSGLVYFTGTSAAGPKLFGLMTAVASPAPSDLVKAVASVPSDPDLHSVWPAGSILGATVTGDTAVVDVTDAAAQAPANTTPQQAKLALKQVVWTLKDAAKVTSVTFTVNGAAATTVLGQNVTTPVGAGDFYDLINQVRIDTPAEGTEVSGAFTATGANNGFEAWVGWKLLDANGKQVKDGFSTAESWMEERLFPWKVQVSLKGVAPGTYTFVAHNDDPSGGEGGSGPDQDTRTIVVK